MKKNLTLLTLILTVVSFLQANNLDYGLYFKSYSSLGKDRTSLVLNDNKPLKIENETTISFDLSIRKELEFGYVIHVVSNSGEKIALNFSAEEGENRYPSIIINESFYPVSNRTEFEKWTPVHLKFSSLKDSLYLSYGNVEKSYPLNFDRWKNIKIAFGVCPFPGFESFETAAMNVKNIRVYSGKKVVRDWVLKEHNENICYDIVSNIPAVAKNPEWIIDRHTNWKKIYSKEFEFHNNPQYAYDAKRGILYIVPDEKSIIAYNPVLDKDSIIRVKGGYPASISTNGLIYDYLNDELLSYNLDEETMSRFSFKDQKWSKTTPCTEETRYWHHTTSINEMDSSIVTFGGYGYYQYKNDIFTAKLSNGIWDKNKLLTVMPRYSSASAVVDGKLYIFGGRGSVTGKQEVNPHSCFDFYAVDLKTKEIKMLWDKHEDVNYLPCGNMIYNTKDSCFYVLTNLKGGTLLRINTEFPYIEKVSNSINQHLAADFLFYTLFFSPLHQKMYALFCCNYKPGTSKILFYEIEFPPLSQAEIVQKEPVVNTSWIKVVALSLFSLFFIGFVFFALKRRRKIIPVQKQSPIIDSPKTIFIPTRETITDPTETIEEQAKKTYDRSKQCIRLLGGFNVIDKNGTNITSSFTPILKNLLLLILLYSEMEEKGINDKKIDSLIWADKDSKAARNNRNVSLTRLKLLLEKVGNVSLSNNSGFWKLFFGEDIFCDYNTSMLHIKKFKGNTIDEKGISELLELLMYGPLLPYTHTDWLDKFKSNYSNDSIDILYNLLLSGNVVKDEELGLQIADAIFLFDSLNEEALRIKCAILYNSGKKGLAKSAYDIFTKEYKTMLGEDYKYSLPQVIDATKNS